MIDHDTIDKLATECERRAGHYYSRAQAMQEASADGKYTSDTIQDLCMNIGVEVGLSCAYQNVARELRAAMTTAAVNRVAELAAAL